MRASLHRTLGNLKYLKDRTLYVRIVRPLNTDRTRAVAPLQDSEGNGARYLKAMNAKLISPAVEQRPVRH
jgi:hypothetical protein